MPRTPVPPEKLPAWRQFGQGPEPRRSERELFKKLDRRVAMPEHGIDGTINLHRLLRRVAFGAGERQRIEKDLPFLGIHTQLCTYFRVPQTPRPQTLEVALKFSL